MVLAEPQEEQESNHFFQQQQQQDDHCSTLSVKIALSSLRNEVDWDAIISRLVPPVPSKNAQDDENSSSKNHHHHQDLEQDPLGIATVQLPPAASVLVQQAWNAIYPLQSDETDEECTISPRMTAFDWWQSNPQWIRFVQANDDTAHCNGYHPHAAHDRTTNTTTTTATSSSSLSNRYNQYRRGLVLSNGMHTCPRPDDYAMPDHTSAGAERRKELDSALTDFYIILHAILDHLLHALARHWHLSLSGYASTNEGSSTHWFQHVMGPTREHSQWHVKEYMTPVYDKEDDITPQEWLPAHTDPSLLSIVMHPHRPSKRTRTTLTHHHTESVQPPRPWQGLQFYHNQTWHDLEEPPEFHESLHHPEQAVPTTAVILVGSVLSALTGGAVRACRHRVVYRPEEPRDTNGGRCRRAAVTLFGRPAPTAPMTCLSPFATATTATNGNPAIRAKVRQHPQTFADWLARVARKYEKAKRTPKGEPPTS